MKSIRCGLSLMPTEDFARAAYPLFEQGIVDTLEWSFDMAWRNTVVPDWCNDLLDFFAQENELTGHGVSFSVLSAELAPWQEHYIERLREETSSRSYKRISEHFGFARGGPFLFNTVFPVPFSTSALAAGRANLNSLQTACGLQVGLENLAFAFSREDVLSQGAFIWALLEPVDGFLVLDLHNIWCQMMNYALTFEEIVSSYPLHRVREVHLSGGTWSRAAQENNRRIRRDTHDDLIPEDLFALLERTAASCPELETVVYERLGNTFGADDTEAERYRLDFFEVRRLVEQLNQSRQQSDRTITQQPVATFTNPLQDDSRTLSEFQNALFCVLQKEIRAAEAKSELLGNSALRIYHPYIESFEIGMLETSQILVKKWGQKAESTASIPVASM